VEVETTATIHMIRNLNWQATPAKWFALAAELPAAPNSPVTPSLPLTQISDLSKSARAPNCVVFPWKGTYETGNVLRLHVDHRFG
jgi:hypothetical protein